MFDHYNNYKNEFQQLGGAKKNKKQSKEFKLQTDDKILFGDGGSTAIIVITKDKRVFKIFTLYYYTKSLEYKQTIKEMNEYVNNEIKIYELLTKEIVNENISKHFVKYIDSRECENAKSLFADCPKSYVDFLTISDEKKTKMCTKYFKRYPLIKLQDNYRVVEIEYCDYSCADFIRDVSKLPEIEMEKYLDIFFFQIIYTILSVQKVYPYFAHNDLFIRNILGTREKDNGNYYTYTFNKKTYYVPQKKFYPKINDFGMTNVDKSNKNMKLFASKYKDIYNLMLDVYDGGNLGSKSLSELCKDNADKIKFIKLYFSNYFNTDVIDKYKSNSKNNMNWDWDNILDEDFLKSIEMKNPHDLIDGYFYNIFRKIYGKVD